jgi:hypothetical protein
MTKWRIRNGFQCGIEIVASQRLTPTHKRAREIRLPGRYDTEEDFTGPSASSRTGERGRIDERQGWRQLPFFKRLLPPHVRGWRLIVDAHILGPTLML